MIAHTFSVNRCPGVAFERRMQVLTPDAAVREAPPESGEGSPFALLRFSSDDDVGAAGDPDCARAWKMVAPIDPPETPLIANTCSANWGV